MEKYLNKKDIIFNDLKRKIVLGKYPSDYKFPNEPAIAKELGVGRVTLRSAFDLLDQAGLIVRIPGKGTFVRPREERSTRRKRFLVLFDDSSYKIESPSKYIIPSFEKFCEKLNIQTDSMDISFLRSGNEENMVEQLKKTIIPAFY